MKLLFGAVLAAALLTLSGCELLGQLGGDHNTGEPGYVGSIRVNATLDYANSGDYINITVDQASQSKVTPQPRAPIQHVATAYNVPVTSTLVQKTLNNIPAGDYTVSVTLFDASYTTVDGPQLTTVTVSQGQTVDADVSLANNIPQ